MTLVIDHIKACNKALGTLARRGVLHYIERDELIGIGCLAIVAAGATEEALAVAVARRAMIRGIRRNEAMERNIIARRDRDGRAYDTRNLDALTYSPVNSGVTSELNEKVLAAARESLTAHQYHAFIRTFRDGASQQEIAAELGIDRSTVSRIISTAKRSIRRVVSQSHMYGVTKNKFGNTCTLSAPQAITCM